MVSQENVDVVRGLFAALDNEDWEARVVRMVEFVTREQAIEAAEMSE